MGYHNYILFNSPYIPINYSQLKPCFYPSMYTPMATYGGQFIYQSVCPWDVRRKAFDNERVGCARGAD